MNTNHIVRKRKQIEKKQRLRKHTKEERYTNLSPRILGNSWHLLWLWNPSNGYYDFCEKVQAVQHHPELTRLFIAKLQDNQVTLAGISFTLSTAIILAATGIPDVGEKLFKQGDLERHYYEPYMKPRYQNERRGYFNFSHLLDRYSPMIKIIMKYFSCEGRFSRLYSYHI